MTNHGNLKPITSSARARELGSKGGKVRSQNKKIAARLRELKKKGLSNQNARRIHDILIDNEFSSLETLLFLESLKKEAASFSEKIQLARALLEWHSKRYPQKILEMNAFQQNNQFNINVEIVNPNGN